MKEKDMIQSWSTEALRSIRKANRFYLENQKMLDVAIDNYKLAGFSMLALEMLFKLRGYCDANPLRLNGAKYTSFEVLLSDMEKEIQSESSVSLKDCMKFEREWEGPMSPCKPMLESMHLDMDLKELAKNRDYAELYQHAEQLIAQLKEKNKENLRLYQQLTIFQTKAQHLEQQQQLVSAATYR